MAMLSSKGQEILKRIPVPSGVKRRDLDTARIQSAVSVIPPKMPFFISELPFPDGVPENTSITLERANCIHGLGRPYGSKEELYGRRFDPRINGIGGCLYCYFSQNSRSCIIKGPNQLDMPLFREGKRD